MFNINRKHELKVVSSSFGGMSSTEEYLRLMELKTVDEFSDDTSLNSIKFVGSIGKRSIIWHIRFS